MRDAVLVLLDHAGFPTSGFRGAEATARIEGLEFIEMRPRDAGSWLAAGRLDAAFISTDIVVEEQLDHLKRIRLGFARSDLVVASRDDDGRAKAGDLQGATLATNLPGATARWFEAEGVDVQIVTMRGALEGVCAAGLADAITDLRETGTSLARNRMRVLAEIERCEAEFVVASGLDDMQVRLQAALEARKHKYLMLHLPPNKIDGLAQIFPGLAAPTVLPLAGRDDLVAVHLVVGADALFKRLADLRELGASGIVALPSDAILR